MYKLCLTLCCCFILTIASAQKQLFFFNKSTNKVVEVHEGNMLVLSYSGYMGQREFAKNVITEITDSFVVLGTNPEHLPGLFKRQAERNELHGVHGYKKIRITDIRGFRKISTGRVVVKSLLSVGAVVGSYFLLSQLYRNNNTSTGNAFLISLGAGIGTTLLINALFPENVKYQLDDGWQLSVTGQ